MKKIVTVFAFMAFLSIGCTDKLNSYLDDPGTIIQDPHYAEYEKQLQQLEHQYLQKEIDYAQYVEKKSQLDDKYTQEVKERNAVIYGEQ